MKKTLIALSMAAVMAAGCADKVVQSEPGKTEEMPMVKEQADQWSTDFAAALAKGKAENKFLLVDFSGSDWCGWCVKLEKEVFSQKAFHDFANDNLVLVLLDFPRAKPQSDAIKAQNKKLMDQYNVQGFPTVLIFNPNGKLVETSGYQPGGAEAYVAFLKKVVDREKAQ